MAIFPKRFSPPKGTPEKRLDALEQHIKYLEAQLEHYASVTNKKIEEAGKNGNK